MLLRCAYLGAARASAASAARAAPSLLASPATTSSSSSSASASASAASWAPARLSSSPPSPPTPRSFAASAASHPDAHAPEDPSSSKVMDDDSLDAFRETVSDFARREVLPHAAAVDADNAFPRPPADLWRALGDMGLLGVTAPVEHGGLGMGYAAHCAAMEELSRASGSVALSYAAHSNLCVNQIARNGTDEQRARLLPDLCSGARVGALAISEPGAGSDAVGMQLRAEPKAGGRTFVLTGTKMWITNGVLAKTLVVYAKTSPERGAKGITAFAVDREAAGVKGRLTSHQKLDKMGMRGSDTCELVFDGVELDAARDVLGEVDAGAKVLMSGLDYERLVLAAGPVGLMQAAIDAAASYSAQRRQFGAPIGSFQLVQARLADMYTECAAARALVGRVARDADAGRLARSRLRADAAAAILLAAESGTRVCLSAVQVLGGNGYVKDYPVERLARDAKLYEIGAGTSEMRRLIIGREMFRAAGGEAGRVGGGGGRGGGGA